MTTEQANFQVRLEVFEGPLDLLLKLIERRQLEISKVSLAAITGEFLAYLETHPGMPPGPLASFVWVASKLLWIKSQSLLPRPLIAHSEDEEEDPGEELVRRLEAYKRVQEAAKWLRSRERQGLRSFERPVALEAKPTVGEWGTGLDGVSLGRLVRVAQKRLQAELPIAPFVGTATRGHTVTVAEKVRHLRGRLRHLKESERIALGEEFALAAMRSRSELVVLFLAVLETIRLKFGVAQQDEVFGEIWLCPAGHAAHGHDATL